MPRPKTASDAAVLGAAYRVISRLGPARLTLADVAREAKLSPATLVQRFGSKRGLLLALAKIEAGAVGDCFAAVRAAHGSPLAALLAAATEMTRHMKSPEELANGLAFLQMDVSDPDFHRIALENSGGIVAGYRALIEEAIAARELIPCDAARLAQRRRGGRRRLAHRLGDPSPRDGPSVGDRRPRHLAGPLSAAPKDAKENGRAVGAGEASRGEGLGTFSG